MKKCSFLSLLLSVLFFSPAHTQAQSYLELAGLSPSTHYQTFETTHFEIVYPDGFLPFAE